MRMPIMQFPQIVSENLKWFASTFSTSEQQKHFCEYVTGLIAGDKATVAAINALFLNRNDQSALNKFLTQANWDEKQLNQRRIEYELARLQRRPVSESAGRLIIDDTLAHHTHCSIEGLAYLKDHTLGRNVWAHNVVTSYYVNRSDQFPVDLQLY
jgi:SRSO17 transposase